eukprot:COSAG01_NODE_4893_length_4645_cov_132.805983_3_plen_84_part_00
MLSPRQQLGRQHTVSLLHGRRGVLMAAAAAAAAAAAEKGPAVVAQQPHEVPAGLFFDAEGLIRTEDKNNRNVEESQSLPRFLS